MSTSARGKYWTAGYPASRRVSVAVESAIVRPSTVALKRAPSPSTVIGWSVPGSLIGFSLMGGEHGRTAGDSERGSTVRGGPCVDRPGSPGDGGERRRPALEPCSGPEAGDHLTGGAPER